MAARRYAQIEITQEEYDAVFASDDDSDSNLSFSDVNVDADLSDIEVQEFSEEESGESESEDSESESDESTASDEPEWSRDLHAFDIEPFSGSHGLKVPVPVEAKAVDFFGLLFGEPVFDLIVEETNRYARQKLARSAARLAKWTDVNKRELKAYFGLCIIMGINTLPRIAMNWSSNRYIGNIGVQETMTKNRFEEISQYMHFSDSTQEPQRGDDDYDRLFKVRRIMNMVLSNFKQIYDPSKNMSIDEGMIAYKGRLSFRQFMPAKPTKYGIKVWMAADAKNGYVSNFAVYLGQAENNRRRIHGLGYDVVMKMTEPFLNNYRHIFFDNFFTSTRLLDHLFAQNTYACGTVRSNRKDLPPCAKHKLRFGEMARAQRGQLVFTKWHDKRDVAFLSTNVSPDEPSRPVPRIHNRQNVNIEKPRVSDVYTAHMGGVDRADQLRSFYCSGWQSKKW